MKPVILVADDDPKSLTSLSEALTRRYSADYRIVAAGSGNAALEELGKSRAAGSTWLTMSGDIAQHGLIANSTSLAWSSSLRSGI